MIVTVVATNVQFSIAVHIMAALACRNRAVTTSALLAKSVNTSPSFVRRVLAKLSRAGLVSTSTGKNGACRIAREPQSVSLLDIYHAVNAPKAFSVHPYSEQKLCQVSCRIKFALDAALQKTQKAMESSLKKIPLTEIISGMNID